MNLLHKYIILQVFALCIAYHAVKHNSANLSVSFNTYSLHNYNDNVGDLNDKIAAAMPENKGNESSKNEELELEKEVDECDDFKIYANDFFGQVHLTSYSKDYEEQYSEQFHPEIVPPPPRA